MLNTSLPGTHLKAQACTILAFSPASLRSGAFLFPFPIYQYTQSICFFKMPTSAAAATSQERVNKRFHPSSNFSSVLEHLRTPVPFVSKGIKMILRFGEVGTHFHFAFVFFLRILGNKDGSLVS